MIYSDYLLCEWISLFWNNQDYIYRYFLSISSNILCCHIYWLIMWYNFVHILYLSHSYLVFSARPNNLCDGYSRNHLHNQYKREYIFIYLRCIINCMLKIFFKREVRLIGTDVHFSLLYVFCCLLLLRIWFMMFISLLFWISED